MDVTHDKIVHTSNAVFINWLITIITTLIKVYKCNKFVTLNSPKLFEF